MAKIKERLIEYLKINNISKQKFCDETGVSYANMVGKSLKSELGGEQIAIILMKFPNINPDWLLLEKGEMLRQNEPKSTENCPVDVVSLEKYEKKVEECALLRAELTALKAAASQYAQKRTPSSSTTSPATPQI